MTATIREGRSSRSGEPAGPGPAAVLLYALAVATPLAWSGVAFVYFGMRAVGKPLSLESALVAGLPEWYVWAMLTPVVFWLGQQVRLERRQWLWTGPAHLVFGTVVALVALAAVTAINRQLGPTVSYVGPEFREVYLRIVLRYFHFAFMIYWVIVLAAHAVRYYRSARQRELEATQLGAELTAAQLSALRGQLQPHFLFNTLHTVASLVRDGRSDAATSTIARLGDLLRHTLGTAQENEVPLKDELSFIRAYLEIEQTRFSDRLSICYDVDRPALEALVPHMSLQPLIENAIHHGIARDPTAGLIEVRAREREGALHIEVRNEGPAFDGRGTAELRKGIGLANTRARLSRLYGNAFRLDVRPDPAGGTLAVLEVPWRPEGAGA